MLLSLTRSLTAAAVVGLLAVPSAQAQEQEPPQEAQALFMELQQIQQQLGHIQQQALEEDVGLQQQQEAIQDLVLETMLRMNPDLESALERMESLQGEFLQAQEAEDMAKMQDLINEAQELQGQIGHAEAQALEQEDVANEVEDFTTKLLDKMKEIEPETEQLIARAEEISERLQAM